MTASQAAEFVVASLKAGWDAGVPIHGVSAQQSQTPSTPPNKGNGKTTPLLVIRLKTVSKMSFLKALIFSQSRC